MIDSVDPSPVENGNLKVRGLIHNEEHYKNQISESVNDSIATRAQGSERTKKGNM